MDNRETQEYWPISLLWWHIVGKDTPTICDTKKITFHLSIIGNRDLNLPFLESIVRVQSKKDFGFGRSSGQPEGNKAGWNKGLTLKGKIQEAVRPEFPNLLNWRPWLRRFAFLGGLSGNPQVAH